MPSLFSLKAFFSLNTKANRQAGFSLLEIIIVLGIIGSIIAAVALSIGGGAERGKVKATGLRASAIQGKLVTFQQDVGKFPTSTENLSALVSNPGSSSKWAGPYLEADDIKDDWGTDFQYELTSKGPKLTSAGADGTAGTADDISFIGGKQVESAGGAGEPAPDAK